MNGIVAYCTNSTVPNIETVSSTIPVPRYQEVGTEPRAFLLLNSITTDDSSELKIILYGSAHGLANMNHANLGYHTRHTTSKLNFMRANRSLSPIHLITATHSHGSINNDVEHILKRSKRVGGIISLIKKHLRQRYVSISRKDAQKLIPVRIIITSTNSQNTSNVTTSSILHPNM